MKKVLLFHGTDLESAQNILQNGINLKINQGKARDFGPGFYLTSSYDSARQWAIRKSFLGNTKPAVLETILDLTLLEQLKYKRFDIGASQGNLMEWAQFIIN